MATPGDRFQSWIDKLGKTWSARLGRWLGTAIGAGIDSFMRILGKSFAPKLRPVIEEMQKSGKIPPWLADIFEEMMEPSGEAAGAVLASLGNRVVSSALGDFLNAYLAPVGYYALRSTRNTRLGVDVSLAAWLRKEKTEEATDYDLSLFGYSDHQIKVMKNLAKVIFPSDIVAPAWLRDKAKYEKYWDDVRKLGVDEDRIELLKEMAYNMPSFRDVVGFLAHEVFEPKMIAKYGLDDEWGEIDKTMFEKVGLKEDMALNYWRDHWKHASWSQVVEMLHRGVISEQDIYDWLRLVEIPPYWRKGLTQTMYNLPGRIEVRMMAQYGLIDKPKIMELLRKDGLAEEYVGVVADMNIVRGVRTDLQTRYMKKWINSEEVKSEIAKYSLSPQIADRLYKWIVTNTAGDRTAAEKDLSAAEIIKGVKKNILTWDEGSKQLIELGYDEIEADYKLALDVEVAEAVPTTEINTRVDTIRRRRRMRSISRDEQIAALLDLRLDMGLATAYADNDDLRLVKETTA